MKTLTIGGKTHPDRRGVKIGSAIFIDKDEYANYVDANDANAGTTNIESGYSGYVGKNKVFGALSKITSFARSGLTPSWVNNTIQISAKPSSKNIIDGNTNITLSLDANALGDADDNTVLNGVTYTSKNGLKRMGKRSAGLDTSDATAVENDVENGKTFYHNSKKTGSLQNVGSGTLTLASPSLSVSGTNLIARITNATKKIIDNGTKIDTQIALSDLGSADPNDVAYGKTITSKAGYHVRGTALLTQTLLFREEMSWGTAETEATLPINLGNILAQDTGYTIGIAIRLRRQTTAAGTPFEIRTVIPLQIYTSTFVLPPANSCVVNVLKDINAEGTTTTVEGYTSRGIYIKSVSQDGSDKINVTMAWDNNSGLNKGGWYNIECWALRVPYRYA